MQNSASYQIYNLLVHCRLPGANVEALLQPEAESKATLDAMCTEEMAPDSPDRHTRINLLDTPGSASSPASSISSSLSSATAVSTRHATPTEKRLTAPTEQRSTVTKRQKTTTATENTTLTGSDHRDLAIVQAAEQGVSVLDSLSIQYESPWRSLRSDYELNLGGFVTVASHREKERDSFIVKRFSGPDMASKLRMLQRIRHANFLSVLQRFSFENSYYVVFDHVSISLTHIVTSPPYLRICELAAILFQVRFRRVMPSLC